MAESRRIRDVLVGRASKQFVGREDELRVLGEFLDGRSPALVWIHGLGGIGKSALLHEYARRASAAGRTILRLDSRFIEPSAEGFLEELERILGHPRELMNEILASLPRPVLVLDSYEVLRLLDGWIRQVFVPGLPANVSVVIASRYGPPPGWRTAIEWQDHFLAIALPPLAETESVLLLDRAGVPASESGAIYRMAGGHPMALVLAGNCRRGVGHNISTKDSRSLVQSLTQLYLEDVLDANLRTAVEAASVVRRTTESLLAAMLPDLYTHELYEGLGSLSIVEATNEGLMLHEAVQEAVSEWLRSSAPDRYRNYRRAAWRQVRAESSGAAPGDRWRYTADMLYLVQHMGLREAFFPTGVQKLSVERAGAGDETAIMAIVRNHEGPEAREAIGEWWRCAPDTFSVLRGVGGEIEGFYIAAELRGLRGRMPAGDPAVVQWQKHLRENPLTSGETALLLRRWLSRSAGEALSPVQAACWLDVKRFHLALRPGIRRCYGAMNDVLTFAPMLGTLGFQVVDNGSVAIDGVGSHLLMLDFGPGSFDGWLGELVSRELGLQNEEIFDACARELALEGERVALTPLEYGVLAYLRAREGKAVSRAELLQHVWQQRPNSGSNVVDVVIRSLRGKLGRHAWAISTVRGVGYRLKQRSSNQR
ncbi:MAG: winged helix-turn-helix domain-containing protein [Bryobacterales bacterium]|nr:winged helix-turn-helix domain-containing protein [Bryobacterales bacterium]